MATFRMVAVPGDRSIADLSLARGQARLLKRYSDDPILKALVGFRTEERAGALEAAAASGQYAFLVLDGAMGADPRRAASSEELLKALDWQWSGRPEQLADGQVSHQAILDCMFPVVMPSGRLVRVTGFSCGLSYAGIFEGTPSDRMNSERKASCLEGAEKRFGEPIVVMEPPIYPLPYPSRPGRRLERYPRMFCAARLESGPIDPEQTCSGITLCWWEERLDRPLPEVVRERLSGVAWEAVARDWDFR